jgi:quaternary ammonium compound-resistance protein SugE
MAWAMVIAAGLLEMVWSYSAKRSDGFTRLGWAGLTVIASLVSFLLLVFSMRRLPLGTAYAVWTGIGATGSFMVGIAALGESANLWRIASAALIVLGVCGLRFTSIK